MTGMAKKVWKYGPLIESLEDGTLYTVGEIVRHGEKAGFYQKFPDPKIVKEAITVSARQPRPKAWPTRRGN